MWPLQRQQWALLCNRLVGALPYSHYVMRSFLLCGVRVFPAQYDILGNHHGDRKNKNKNKKKRYSVCLAHAVTGMFYIVVAYQRQPQYTYNGSQRRSQPRLTIRFPPGGGVGYRFVTMVLGVLYIWVAKPHKITKECSNKVGLLEIAGGVCEQPPPPPPPSGKM